MQVKSKYKLVQKEVVNKPLHGYPTPLEIISDGNRLEYVKHDTEGVEYRYIQAGEKFGTFLYMKNDQLAKMLGWKETRAGTYEHICTVVAKIIL